MSSHLAFCNYLREFFGPQYSEKCVPLRKYTKKGAEFKDYDTDTVAQASREWLIAMTIDKVVLVVPDWEAAARPWETCLPFELYLDASDVAWSALYGENG